MPPQPITEWTDESIRINIVRQKHLFHYYQDGTEAEPDPWKANFYFDGLKKLEAERDRRKE